MGLLNPMEQGLVDKLEARNLAKGGFSSEDQALLKELQTEEASDFSTSDQALLDALQKEEEGYQSTWVGKYIPEEDIARGVNMFPGVGAGLGAAMGVPLIPETVGMSPVIGATLGARAGQSLADATRTALRMKTAPQTTEEVQDRNTEAAREGALLQMGGEVIPPVAGMAYNNVLKPLVKHGPGALVSYLTKSPAAGIAVNLAKNSYMDSAKKALGKLGPKMDLPPLELLQYEERAKELAAKEQGLVDEIVSGESYLSPSQSGEDIVEGITKNVRERVAPISKKFDEVSEVTKDLPVNPQIITQTRLNIANMPEFVKNESSPGSNMVRNVLVRLDEATNINDIKIIRTDVKEQLQNIEAAVSARGVVDTSLRNVLRKLDRHLGGVENRLIKAALPDYEAQMSLPIEDVGQVGALKPTTVRTAKSVPGTWRWMDGDQLGTPGTSSPDMTKYTPTQVGDAIPVTTIQKEAIPGVSEPPTYEWTPHKTLRQGVATEDAGFQTSMGIERGTPKGTETLAKHAEARKEWAKLMSDQRKLGLGNVSNPEALLAKLKSRDSTRIVSDIFNPKKLGVTREMEKQFPEQFKLAKSAELRTIANKARNDVGDVDPAKLSKIVTKIQRETPEKFDMLFGDRGVSLEKLKRIIQEVDQFPERQAAIKATEDSLFESFSKAPPIRSEMPRKDYGLKSPWITLPPKGGK